MKVPFFCMNALTGSLCLRPKFFPSATMGRNSSRVAQHPVVAQDEACHQVGYYQITLDISISTHQFMIIFSR